MPSSVIRHIHYKPETRQLSIWFAQSGRRYRYEGVPQEIVDAFMRAPSRGQFFNETIRNRFACTLVSDPLGRRQYFG